MTTSNSASVLMPAGSSRTEYVVFRSLRERGIPVYIADSSRVGMCQWSRFGAWVWKRRDATRDATEFIGDLVRLVEETRSDILLPTDESTVLIAQYRDRFAPGLRIPLACYETLALADNKRSLTNLAQALSIPVPVSYTYLSREDLRGTLEGAEAPFIIKAVHSYGSRGVFLARDVQTAVHVCAALIEADRLPPDRYPLVQQYIDAEGWGVSCLYWHGEKIITFTHKRLREKMPFGTSTLRVSARAPLLEQAAARLLAALHWHGLAMVEFKYDPGSQRYWLIEMNPRVWGSIALPVYCGVDFPYLVYQCATGHEAQAGALAAEASAYPVGKTVRWLLGDAVQCASSIASLQLTRAREIAITRADHCDDLRWDDLGAFLGEIAYYAMHGVSWSTARRKQARRSGERTCA